MRVSISHDDIVVRKGFLGRETRYRVTAWIDFSDEERTIVRAFALGRHEAYTAEEAVDFPKFVFTINDLIYQRPHIRVFPTALAARTFEQELAEDILPKVKNYILGNAAARHPSSYEI
ncbi:MAG: hypothetical protein WBO09_13495 [Methylocystis silviterrae]|uniref:hypothetical protein n=1 Tax=Methylocystis silviterrae TaxID=2743612 RepID=UPI003C7146D1